MPWITEAVARRAQRHPVVLEATRTVQTMRVAAEKRLQFESEQMVAVVRTHVVERRRKGAVEQPTTQ